MHHIHAFVLCHISYVAAMLNWKKTEEKRLDTMIRRVFKVSLGLPINASTDLVLKLGVHNTLSEIGEAQHTAQVGRLSGTRAGRDILVTLGIFTEQNKDSVKHLSREIRDSIVVRPSPRNVHPVFNQGRRLSRAKALLAAALESPTESAFVDAAQINGRQAFSIAVTDAQERMCNALSVFTKNPEVAEQMAVALALLDPQHMVNNSDSRAATRAFARGVVDAKVSKLLEDRHISNHSIVWFPAHMGELGGDSGTSMNPQTRRREDSSAAHPPNHLRLHEGLSRINFKPTTSSPSTST
ncbi:hypothetical protein HPB48_019924 [Haemaphysalis longicornis]|uniref:Tick transposon n=1 Tax=Haemaphysalis longicornis TaxID=44386 RepID=A0A9J6FTQ4_HAELO|nr:hypothetical protein HPB48_019924 [Haemaphysalis longicornis]